MATTQQFDPKIHFQELNQFGVEQRQVNERIHRWLTGLSADIDGLSSGPIDATLTYLTLNDEDPPLTQSRRLAATSPIALTDNGAGNTLAISLGLVGIPNGGTGQITAQLGFKALAPVASSAGQMIAYNTTTGVWEATTSLSLNRNTDYGILMGAITPTIGVAYREMSNAHFLVDTGAATLSLAPDGVDNTILANMAEATIKGRAAGAGTGNPTDLTAAEVATILGTASVFAPREPLPHVHHASAIAWGTLGVQRGGTGLSSLAEGDILYADTTNSLAALPFVATATRYLANTGASSSPAWAQVNLTNGVTGLLPINSLVKGSGIPGDMMVISNPGAGTQWVLLTGGTTDQILVWDDAVSTQQPLTWETVAGDLTMSGGVFTIGLAKVTFAKMQDIATDRLIGRDTAGTGPPEQIALNATLEFTGGPGIQRAALTGDVTAAAGSNSTSIANGVVTNAKLADMAEARIKGRAAGAGTGVPQDLTGAQVATIIGATTFAPHDDSRFTSSKPTAHIHHTSDTAWGVFPLARGGTNASDSPTATTASIGFSNLAPQVSVPGRFIVWDQNALKWTATTTLSTGDNTLLMGSTTLDIGVAVRTLDPTYFSVDTGTGVVSLTGMSGVVDDDYRLVDARPPRAHIHNAGDIAWGTLVVARGGTGISTVAQGDVLYAPLANTISGLAKNTTATRYLSNTGASNNPAWAQVNLADGVTGTLPIGNGGTGQITAPLGFKALAPTNAGGGTLIIYNAAGAGTWDSVAAGTNTQLLVVNTSLPNQPLAWVTVSGDVTQSIGVFTIAANAVTFSKFQTITTDRLLGRDTAGTGVVEQLQLNQTLEFTGVPGIQRAALTGDVTAAAGSNSTSIVNNAVTNAKLAEMPTMTIKGNNTAGTTEPLDLTATEVRTLLSLTVGTNIPSHDDARFAEARRPVGHRHFIYDVIASGTPSTMTFLRGDGAWGAPVGSMPDDDDLILATQVYGA